MSAPYLYIPPDQASFQVSLANGTISTDTAGGAPRFRRDFIGSDSIARVAWTVGPIERDVIVGFLEDAVEDGSRPFEIDLYAGANGGQPLERYVAHLIPGSFRQTRTTGNTHVLGADLSVRRPPDANGFRAAQALAASVGTGDSRSVLNFMNEIVNTNLADQSALPPL